MKIENLTVGCRPIQSDLNRFKPTRTDLKHVIHPHYRINLRDPAPTPRYTNTVLVKEILAVMAVAAAAVVAWVVW